MNKLLNLTSIIDNKEFEKIYVNLNHLISISKLKNQKGYFLHFPNKLYLHVKPEMEFDDIIHYIKGETK